MLKTNSIRPTLVRSRRVIFDVLQSHVGKSFSFLDAFAGSGIMGIEALSRGSEKVVFVDINGRTLKEIKENIESMPKIQGLFSTLKSKIFQLPDGSPLDVVFLDPPYEKYFIIPKVIKYLQKKNWINTETIIITELHEKNSFEIPAGFEIFKETKISKSKILFLKCSEEDKTTLA